MRTPPETQKHLALPALMAGLLLGTSCGLMLTLCRQRPRFSFQGRTVVITGGSRGLGLVLARQLAREGARLAILARNSSSLLRAEAQLSTLGAEVLPLVCDVRRQDDVNDALQQIVNRFGRVDVLINNAGIIQVGPMPHMTLQDFEDALAVHLFGPLFCTLAVLPYMRQAGGGRIVNISSIGGQIAFPHLLPYSVSKFALVGLSDGLRAELRQDHILVTTVCPNLMRTGSPRNALFKGRHRREYAWFAVSDSLPLLSVNAERAASQIIEAARRGAARLLIGAPAKAAVLANTLWPGLVGTLMAWTNRLLPSPEPELTDRLYAGYQSQTAWAPSRLTALSDQAARKNNEIAPPLL